MGLCASYERIEAGPSAPGREPWADLTPEERDAIQEQIITRWLALPPGVRNLRLARERQRLGLPSPLQPTHPPAPLGPPARIVMHADQSRTIRQWAEALGVDPSTIYKRLATHGS